MDSNPVILGIGGVLGDAAAVLLKDGEIAAAVEEGKLTRRPPSGKLPQAAVDECLRIAKVAPEQVNFVALARPLPPGSGIAVALRAFPNARVVSIDHHAAHAASAYLASPFHKAVVITLDREGDLRCGGKWRGKGNELELDEEILYPDSIGELYGRVTELVGFRARADEHLVQWLSATGKPLFAETFDAMVQGTAIDRSYFDAGRQGQGGFSARFFESTGIREIGAANRADVAASMQKALEDYVMRLAGDAENICLAGGVAWNALLISALERSGRYKGVFAQPAAGNAGTALGAALNVWNHVLGQRRRIDGGGYCFGPSFAAGEIKEVLENCKLRFQMLPTTPELIGAAVDQLTQNRIVAWMQGRMEFGPRALGNRSILASPQDPYSTENLNAFIKRREGFRKFAASVPAELAGTYFEAGANARHLATVGRVRPEWKEQFRGAILGGDLVRVHAVQQDDNPLYWRLLHAFGEKTGLPVLYNTSFNLFGEPLVCTPRDAVRSFYASGIDAMVAGNFLLQKSTLRASRSARRRWSRRASCSAASRASSAIVSSPTTSEPPTQPTPSAPPCASPISCRISSAKACSRHRSFRSTPVCSPATRRKKRAALPEPFSQSSHWSPRSSSCWACSPRPCSLTRLPPVSPAKSATSPSRSCASCFPARACSCFPPGASVF